MTLRFALSRRRFFASAAASLALPSALVATARAQMAGSDPVVREIIRGAPLNRGRVKLELPILADNGNAVPLRVSVDSPMNEKDYVRSIRLVSDRNPVRNMANFYLGPRAGRAEVQTRVRLAGSQTVTAVAELSDGTFWMDSARVQVTLSACADES